MEPDLGVAIVRVVVGLTFAAHGAQKAFGWWGGPGYHGWNGIVGKMGWRPVAFWAPIAIAAELIGGLGLAVGLLVPLAAAALVAQSIVIIRRVHWPAGFWNTAGGMEYPVVLLACALGLFFTGPGNLSLDALLPVEALYEREIAWPILGVAVLGGVAAALWPPPVPVEQHG